MPQVQQQGSGLEAHGITNVARIYWNQSVPSLYEEAVRRREGLMSVDGPTRLPDRPAHRPLSQ